MKQPDNNKVVAFVQFSYRTENKVFIGAFSDLLRERGAKGVFITDDQKAPGHWASEILQFRLTNNGQPPLSVGANASVPNRWSGPRSLAHVSRLRNRLYTMKLDILKGLEIFRKLRFTFSTVYSQENIVSLVGIEPLGGFVAGLVALVLRKPFVYCSMELQIRSFKTWMGNTLFEFVFKRILRRALLVTVQDMDRARVLQNYYQLPGDRISLMPVGTTELKRYEKTDYLYRKLGIETSRRIILYAGSIRAWACVLDIAKSAHYWPHEYCLVIHGFVSSKDNEYFMSIQEYVDNEMVYLSTEILPWSELDSLLCSGHMSIAAYSDKAENTSYISASSNKLASYARCGLPLLITHSGNVARMFEKIAWGVTFRDFNDIPGAMSAIANDYEGYRKRCYQAFENFYDLNFLGRTFADAIVGSYSDSVVERT